MSPQIASRLGDRRAEAVDPLPVFCRIHLDSGQCVRRCRICRRWVFRRPRRHASRRTTCAQYFDSLHTPQQSGVIVPSLGDKHTHAIHSPSIRTHAYRANTLALRAALTLVSCTKQIAIRSCLCMVSPSAVTLRKLAEFQESCRGQSRHGEEAYFHKCLIGEKSAE